MKKTENHLEILDIIKYLIKRIAYNEKKNMDDNKKK